MKNKLLAIFLIFLILSCQNGLEVDSTKHTATDPIADITYLNGYFYTTNLDISANAGPQIDLYKFDNEFNPVDRFELDMNGQGYLAAANDGTNLYFQPRFTDYILKMTPLGEIFWYESDYFPDNMADTTSTFMYWGGRGIAWADTNLVVLYRHKNDSMLYRGRYLHLNNDTLQTISDTTVTWNHLNDSGAFSLEYNPEKKGFLVLATNNLNQSILFEVDNYFQNIVILDTLEGTPMGVTLDETLDIYLSYPDRRIEKLTD
jgi:hypothetical protein